MLANFARLAKNQHWQAGSPVTFCSAASFSLWGCRVPSKAFFTAKHLTVLGSFPNCSFKKKQEKKRDGEKRKKIFVPSTFCKVYQIVLIIIICSTDICTSHWLPAPFLGMNSGKFRDKSYEKITRITSTHTHTSPGSNKQIWSPSPRVCEAPRSLSRLGPGQRPRGDEDPRPAFSRKRKRPSHATT